MAASKTIYVSSRKSQLAMYQTNEVIGKLQASAVVRRAHWHWSYRERHREDMLTDTCGRRLCVAVGAVPGRRVHRGPGRHHRRPGRLHQSACMLILGAEVAGALSQVLDKHLSVLGTSTVSGVFTKSLEVRFAFALLLVSELVLSLLCVRRKRCSRERAGSLCTR